MTNLFKVGGDPIYVYQKGCGYVGLGVVRSSATKSDDFRLPDGRELDDVDLMQQAILLDSDDDKTTDYIVGVDWVKTVLITDAKTLTGAVANQNVVCKLRDPATLEFLANEFGDGRGE